MVEEIIQEEEEIEVVKTKEAEAKMVEDEEAEEGNNPKAPNTHRPLTAHVTSIINTDQKPGHVPTGITAP